MSTVSSYDYEIIIHRYGNSNYCKNDGLHWSRPGGNEIFRFRINQSEIYENKKVKDKIIFIYHENEATLENIYSGVYFATQKSLNDWLKLHPEIKSKIGKEYYTTHALNVEKDCRAVCETKSINV